MDCTVAVHGVCYLTVHMLFPTKDDHHSIERKHMKDLSSISPFRFTPTDSVARGTSHISAGAIPAAPPCSTPKEIYDRVHQEISRRYLSFDQGKEMGFAGKAGVTGDIDFITKKDLIGILRHLKEDESALQESKKDSARTQLFDKIYLMSGDKETGSNWNLRLQNYSVRGTGLGGEDIPHRHRWTLASNVLTGGYNNVNYEERSVSQPHDPKDKFNKYVLGASSAQTTQGARGATLVNEAVMVPFKNEIYAKGDIKHFPIALPHSVDTAPAYMGTTLTLAHTGVPTTDTSIAYYKEAFTSLPSLHFESVEAFKASIDLRIAQLQVLDLQDNLSTFLNARQQNSEPLTPDETRHLRDTHEYNYVETSLLPALAIYNMEKINGIEHREFSADTAKFLDSQLSQINQRVLNTLIEGNQTDLMDQRLSLVLEPGAFAQAMAERQGQ